MEKVVVEDINACFHAELARKYRSTAGSRGLIRSLSTGCSLRWSDGHVILERLFLEDEAEAIRTDLMPHFSGHLGQQLRGLRYAAALGADREDARIRPSWVS